jgi:hypothetical protein
MEHPILFISVILEAIGLPVPHGPVGETLLAKIVSPHLTYTWLVMAFLIIVPKLTLGKLEMVPGKGQNFWELIIGGLEGFMAENMGEEGARLVPDAGNLCLLYPYLQPYRPHARIHVTNLKYQYYPGMHLDRFHNHPYSWYQVSWGEIY